tara:strand:- start:2369 stop:3040 length:672 start_codon:yes stop_codon:yes gene_type:complete
MPRQTQLSKEDDYEKLKAIVHRGLDAWYEAARAAEEIRERNLWRIEYQNWAEFVQQEFGQSARRIYQFMEAAQVVDMLPGIELNESQARALVGTSQARAENILEKIQQDGGKLTAKRIKDERAPVVVVEDPEITMSMEIGMCAADVRSAVDFMAKQLNDPNYYMVKKAWPRIRAAYLALCSAMEWGILEHDCPHCASKPGGCKHCNGTGMVNQALIDNRDDRL